MVDHGCRRSLTSRLRQRLKLWGQFQPICLRDYKGASVALQRSDDSVAIMTSLVIALFHSE